MENMNVKENHYASYQGMMAEVVTSLEGMAHVCDKLELNEASKQLEASREKLKSHRFSVGILGEFKRGKSTVINSLLEQEIMPADILPCSATMNRVTYDLKPHVLLTMTDGSEQIIGVDELTEYVTKMGEHTKDVREAVVYYPCRFCQNGVDIVDTPGLNDDDRMTRITEETIPKLDAVIMVLTHDSPFSQTEADFVRNKLMSSDLSRIIFLVNKIDTIRRKQDRQRVLDTIRQRIEATVLEKMEALYGADSQQYRDAQMKLGNIRIFGISALDALEGKQEGDQEMIERSGTLPFEEALTRMLTVERGALELGTPISAMEKTTVEIAKAIESRKNALNMTTAEFETKQQEALQQLKTLRERKRAEEKRLRQRSKDVQRDITAQLPRFYPELQKKLMSVVDGYNPDPAPFAKPEGQRKGAQELQKMVVETTNNAISDFSEKIVSQIQDIIKSEAVESARVTGEITARMQQIMSVISQPEGFIQTTDLVATGVDVLTDFVGIPGIGGFVAGYRTAGVKGAVVGGGIGLFANLALAGVLATVGLPFLPLSIITCMAGTVVSKGVSSTIFGSSIGRQKLNEIKDQVRRNIEIAVQEMQASRDFEKWVDEQVRDRFDELVASMDRECETILADTESSMTAIQKDLTQNQAQRSQTLKMLDDAAARCKEIMRDLQPISEKVHAALAMEV